MTDTLERIGVMAVLGPAAGPIQEQVETMVLAQVGSRALGILRGHLDGQRLLNSLKSRDSEVESEIYGAFEILRIGVQVPFLTLTVALSFVDDNTAIFGFTLSPQRSSIDIVKGALDTMEGSEPGFLTSSAIGDAITAVPPGFAMGVTNDCSFFGQYDGCIGMVLSAEKEAEDGIVHAVLEFESPEQAEAALMNIREGVANPDFVKSAEIIQSSLEETTVTIVIRVNLDEALEVALQAGMS